MSFWARWFPFIYKLPSYQTTREFEIVDDIKTMLESDCNSLEKLKYISDIACDPDNKTLDFDLLTDLAYITKHEETQKNVKEVVHNLRPPKKERPIPLIKT